MVSWRGGPITSARASACGGGTRSAARHPSAAMVMVRFMARPSVRRRQRRAHEGSGEYQERRDGQHGCEDHHIALLFGFLLMESGRAEARPLSVLSVAVTASEA